MIKRPITTSEFSRGKHKKLLIVLLPQKSVISDQCDQIGLFKSTYWQFFLLSSLFMLWIFGQLWNYHYSGKKHGWPFGKVLLLCIYHNLVTLLTSHFKNVYSMLFTFTAILGVAARHSHLTKSKSRSRCGQGSKGHTTSFMAFCMFSECHQHVELSVTLPRINWVL